MVFRAGLLIGLAAWGFMLYLHHCVSAMTGLPWLGEKLGKSKSFQAQGSRNFTFSQEVREFYLLHKFCTSANMWSMFYYPPKCIYFPPNLFRESIFRTPGDLSLLFANLTYSVKID